MDPNQQINSELPTAPPTSKKSRFLVYLLLLVLVLVVVAVVVLIAAYKPKSSSPQTKLTAATVYVSSSGFSPATIKVKLNQVVVWINDDSAAHEVAADPYPTDNGILNFNSHIVLLHGDSYNFIFSKKGIYHYHDQLNPKLTGTVDVE